MDEMAETLMPGGLAGKQAVQHYKPTMRQRMLQQKADLTQRLADVDKALTLLDKNPDFEECLNIIGKVSY